MFWSLLNTTTADGLVDIVKLCQDSGQGIKVGSMTDIVERPGYDLGSAFCVQGKIKHFFTLEHNYDGFERSK